MAGIGVRVADRDTNAPLLAAWFNVWYANAGDGLYYLYDPPQDGWVYTGADGYIGAWSWIDQYDGVTIWLPAGTTPPTK
jgi:hypothetical protein